MYPQVRSPLASWLLTVFTGGIYLVFWFWRVANELNSAENKNVFDVGLWRSSFFALLLLAVAGFAITASTKNPMLLLVSILGLFGLCLHVQVTIGNYIKSKDNGLAIGKSYSNGVSVTLLWLGASLGVAYMQSGINRIIEHERAHS